VRGEDSCEKNIVVVGEKKNSKSLKRRDVDGKEEKHINNFRK